VPDDQKLPPTVFRAMIVILAVFALVSIYANLQRLRRDKVEKVIVTPIATPAPSTSASPAPQ